ncbi:MAG: PD-(D/E)XK nuclease family protein, partial [Betaproteobacteria bacterium]|nr:PD-(D/E)XK nuclease family protein [Betaproteobacteria bacterium]
VFVAALGELRASSQPSQDIPVQVMTMHKAKGLEFDTVILPGLGRKGRGATHELLRWRERTRGLLIAPSKAPGGEDDPVFAHLKRVEKEESAAELGRLLYVACTRARSHLHLVAVPGIGKDKSGTPQWKPVASSSLAKLAIDLSTRPSPEAPAAETEAAPATPPRLLRAPPGFAPQPDDDGLAPGAVHAKSARRDVPFDWAQERARVIGTLAHRLLARVGEGGPWDEARIAAFAPRVRADLAQAGFGDDEVGESASRVLDAVRRTLADERGRWIFDRRHADARSEWGIAGVDDGEVVHVVLDRTFVADGQRWVVDFKTGTHEGSDAAGFLDSEAERYREQLQRYGRLLAAMEQRPVRLALYYPLIRGGFREIAAD